MRAMQATAWDQTTERPQRGLPSMVRRASHGCAAGLWYPTYRHPLHKFLEGRLVYPFGYFSIFKPTVLTSDLG
jgi:hypothetical protein